MPDVLSDLFDPVSASQRVLSVARAERIPDDIANDYLRLTRVESGHNVNVRDSSKGAQGFGQVMPDRPGGSVRTVGNRQFNLRDPDQNIAAGLNYFAEGGSDPVARRLYYFGGPKAQQSYERTGRIPNISDGNMTAAQYVQATGGAQRQPQDPLSDLFDSKTSEQVSPPAGSGANTGQTASTQQPAPNEPIEVVLKRIMDETNRMTARLKRQAARQQSQQPPIQPRPDLTVDAGPGASVELDPATMRPLTETMGSSNIGELRRADQPEVTRIQRLQAEETQRAAPLAPTADYMGTLTPRQRSTRAAQIAAQRASEERAAEVKAQQEQSELDRLTEQYRQEIRQAAAVTPNYGPTQWFQEALHKGEAGLLEAGAGIVRAAKYNPLAPEAEGVAARMRLHAEAMQRAAIEEGADRNVVSRTLQDATAGLISTAPEVAATSLGAPPIATFGVGGGVRAYGRGATAREVAKEVAKGATIGAAFDLPVPEGVVSPLKRAAVKGLEVGAGTGAVELASGASPSQAASSAITNALFGAHGELKRGAANSSALERPSEPQIKEVSREVDERPAFVRAGRQLGERTGQFIGNEEVTPSPNQQGVKGGYTRVLRHRDGEQQIVKNDQIVEKPVVSIKGVEESSPQSAVTPQSEINLQQTRFIPNVGEVTTSANQRGVKRGYQRVEINGAQRIVPESSIVEGYKVRDAQLGETPYSVVRDFQGKESFLPQDVPHQSAFQAREKTGEFKKGSVVPAGEQVNAGTIRSNQEVVQEVPPISERQRSEVARSENIYRGERQSVDQVAPSQVVTRRQAEPAKIEAEIRPPLARAPLQVRPATEPRAPLTLVRNQSERSFPKSVEAAGLPGGENREYDPITNEESLARADKRIKQVGVDRAATEIAMRKDASSDDVATGIRLMQTFTQAGQHERAADIAGDLAEKLTRAGQSVQAASIISRLSPEGVLLTAQRQLPAGKKLTAAQSEALTGQARTVQERDARVADLEKQVAEMRANVEAKKVSKPKLTEKIGTLEDRLAKLETDARARLQARVENAQKLGPQAGASAIPLDLADYAIVGAAKIARKGMSPAKWTAEMLSEFGEAIRPHLQKIYRESYGIYDDNRKQMKAEAEQRSIQREHPNAQPNELASLIQQRSDARKDARTERAKMARLFNDLTATPWTRAKAAAGDVLNIPRTLKSSLDLSAPRQGAMWILNHPIEGAKTFFGKQIKAMREVNYDKFVDELESDPDYALMTRSGLALTSADSRTNALTAREEAFMSRLAGKIPGVSHSERAYTTFLDTARASWFKQLKNVAQMKAQAENRQVAPEEYQAIANFVNIATGRGNLGKGWLNNASPFLNAVFFAPKFAVSKVQIFDPRVYARMPKGARTQAMREGATYFGAMAATAMLLKYGLQANVSLDPESSEFMKLRVGNTRYDLTNGTGQYVTLAARLLRNAENKRTGKKDKPGSSLQENVDRFTRYKYSPPAAMARNVWEGKNAIGEKTNLKKEALEVVMPLFEKDLYDAYKEEGLTGLAKTSPGLVGVGVNTYGDKKRK